jgi:hypothetical protein
VARKCVQGVHVDKKICAQRYPVDVRRMERGCVVQRTENSKVRRKKLNEILTTYMRMTRCVVGRAWIGIPAPVSPTSWSINLGYTYLDAIRVYKHVAYIRFAHIQLPVGLRVAIVQGQLEIMLTTAMYARTRT